MSVEVSAQQVVVFAPYEELLREQDVFEKTLQEYARGSAPRLESLFQLIDNVFEILAELGLRNQSNVYLGVKRQAQNVFAASYVWHLCHISGVTSRDCVQVDDVIFVHKKYHKWLQCLWLTTHVREQEQARWSKTLVSGIPPAHVIVYHRAIKFVLEQLEELYSTVVAKVPHTKKHSI